MAHSQTQEIGRMVQEHFERDSEGTKDEKFWEEFDDPLLGAALYVHNHRKREPTKTNLVSPGCIQCT